MNKPLTRIIAADDHEFLLDGIETMINNEPGIELVGKARNGRQLIDLARSVFPDVIITDLRMPDMTGLDVVKELEGLHPWPACIILSMFDDDHLVIQAAKAGVMGYVTKGAPKEELAAAIHSVRQNVPYFCPAVSGKLVKYFHPQEAVQDVIEEPVFTEEEKEVVRMICQSKSTKEMCKALFKSKTVIGELRARVKKKIGAKNVADLVKYAIKAGIIKD